MILSFVFSKVWTVDRVFKKISRLSLVVTIRWLIKKYFSLRNIIIERINRTQSFSIETLDLRDYLKSYKAAAAALSTIMKLPIFMELT